MRSQLTSYLYKCQKAINVKSLFLAIGLLTLTLTVTHKVSFNNKPALEAPLGQYAKEILNYCVGKEEVATCYEEEIPKLLDKLTLEDTFNVVTLIQKQDPEYPYCHVLAHKLGARQVRQNSENWKEILASCTAENCSNGCTHGVLQERFNIDSLPSYENNIEILKDLRVICHNRPNRTLLENERTACYHALGHTSLYLTKANLKESIQICLDITTPDQSRYLQNCYEGLFMQIFQPIEPEDIELAKNLTQTKETLFDFCSTYNEEAKEACWREGWVLTGEDIAKAPNLNTYCSKINTPRAISNCYSKMFFIIMGVFNFDESKMENLCLDLEKPWQETCFADGATRFITASREFADQALSMCERASHSNNEKLCFSRLASYSVLVFPTSSPEFEKYCSKFPQPWQTKCFEYK